jgi:cytoskeletal protein CcmA (bactofilin family)
MWGRDKQKETQEKPTTARPKATSSQPIETTIGPNTHIKGNIEGDGGLRIEGVLEGNVKTTGNLVITESAKVFAEIEANNISIAGAIRGNIQANRAEILDTGRVWGDVKVKTVLINEGGYVSGQIIMQQDLQPPKLESENARSTSTPVPPKRPKSSDEAEEEKK